MWRINLSGTPLDLVSLPVQQSVVSLLAVSVAKIGIKIYDEKHHVDTIQMMDSVSAIKVLYLRKQIIFQIIIFIPKII